MVQPKILFTTNLGMFKFHDVNRSTDTVESKNRIKAIALSMKEDGLFPHAIIITSKGYVVDGQHRLKAAMIAGKGIYYIIDDSIKNTPKDIFRAASRYNKSAKVWSKQDYIKGYVAQNVPSYVTLDEFRNKYPMFTLTEAMMLLENSGSKHAQKINFAEGKFQVKNVKKAEQWAENLIKLKPYFEHYNTSVFVRTMLTIQEKKPQFDFERFLHKVKLRPGMIKKQGDKDSYKLMIEDIYNYRAGSDDRLNLRF